MPACLPACLGVCYAVWGLTCRTSERPSHCLPACLPGLAVLFGAGPAGRVRPPCPCLPAWVLAGWLDCAAYRHLVPAPTRLLAGFPDTTTTWTRSQISLSLYATFHNFVTPPLCRRIPEVAYRDYDYYMDTHRLRIAVSNMKNANTRERLDEIRTTCLRNLALLPPAPSAQMQVAPPKTELVRRVGWGGAGGTLLTLWSGRGRPRVVCRGSKPRRRRRRRRRVGDGRWAGWGCGGARLIRGWGSGCLDAAGGRVLAGYGTFSTRELVGKEGVGDWGRLRLALATHCCAQQHEVRRLSGWWAGVD
jgi:hypothetical protein